MTIDGEFVRFFSCLHTSECNESQKNPLDLTKKVALAICFQFAFKLTYFKHIEIIKGFECTNFSSNYASVCPALGL